MNNSTDLLSPTCDLFSNGTNCMENKEITMNTTISNMTCGKQEFFSSTYAIVGTSVQGIIFLVGVLGNVLVCCVVSRSRSMHTTTNCYLVSLAVADTITLVASVPQEILSYHILGHRWVWGPVGCTLMIYLQYLGIDASALSLTAFTVERYIAICHPIKSKFICTLSRAKKVIVGCWIFAICYCSPWFFLTNTTHICVHGVGNITKCSFRLRRDSTEYLVLFFADLMLFYVYPLLLSIVLYGLIAKALLTRIRSKFPMGRDDLRSKAAIKTNQSRVQVVKMLACVVLIFATLWVPYRGMLVYNTFNASSPYLDLWFLMFAKTCIYMNCAINPILYNAMSDKFRKAFRTFLVCYDGKRRNQMGFGDEPLLVQSSQQPTICYRANSSVDVSHSVTGITQVSTRPRNSTATITTEAQITHTCHTSEEDSIAKHRLVVPANQPVVDSKWTNSNKYKHGSVEPKSKQRISSDAILLHSSPTSDHEQHVQTRISIKMSGNSSPKVRVAHDVESSNSTLL